MLSKECIEFATANPLAYVATTDGKQPHVRIILLSKTDETGFYIPTLSPKRVFDQLKANPKVELCFYNNPAELKDARQMRAVGTVEQVTDPKEIETLRKDRAWIKDITEGRVKDEHQVLFRLAAGKVVFWTLGDILKERDMEWASF